MPQQESEPIILSFGGGLNTRRRPHDIDINECVDGENFDLDPQLFALTKRKSFDLAATAPNAGSIDGYAQLVKRDGTITTLIQAGTNVYQWDHSSTFTLKGTVAAGTKMRGGVDQNFTLDEIVIITDIALAEKVKTWDGTTFADLAHNLTGTFSAKYCRVHQERAFYANVKNAATLLPHILVGSQRSDADRLSVTDRPASVLVLTDPFFLVTPDLRPINGLELAFGNMLLSTARGRLFRLSGSSAFDFAVEEFHAGSAVSGDEAMISVGNDVALGNPHHIDSLSGTINFGDVESDDLSLPISNRVERVTEWTLTYDHKSKRLYCFPDGQSAVYVMHKKLIDSKSTLSPWSKWTTGHSIAFQPTTAFPLIDPTTKESRMFMGDSSGRIFIMDGDGAKDGGTTDLTASRTSGLIRGIPDGDVFDVEGWISYRKQFVTTVTLTFLFAGEGIFDKSLTITLPAGDIIPIYNGSGTNAAYYNTDIYHGVSFSDRISRQRFTPPGLNAWFQVKVEISSQGDVEIDEIGFRFRTAKA
jgi:hypothetical protein